MSPHFTAHALPDAQRTALLDAPAASPDVAAARLKGRPGAVAALLGAGLVTVDERGVGRRTEAGERVAAVVRRRAGGHGR